MLSINVSVFGKLDFMQIFTTAAKQNNNLNIKLETQKIVVVEEIKIIFSKCEKIRKIKEHFGKTDKNTSNIKNLEMFFYFL